MRIGPALIALVMGLVACSQSESIYFYPGGLFSVKHPTGWRVAFDDTLHMASFIPPDERGAITISAHDQLPVSAVEDIASTTKPMGSPVTPRKQVPALGEDSFIQEFEKQGADGITRFIALFVFQPEGTLIVSGNASAEHFEEQRAAFTRILMSTEIHRR